MDANVRNTINEYFKSKPIQKAWVFGSVARGEEHSDSDVDILVHRPVDLVVEGDLLPFAVESANKDKILVYEQQVEGYLRENDI